MKPTHLCRNKVYRRGTVMRCNRPTYDFICESCQPINENEGHHRWNQFEQAINVLSNVYNTKGSTDALSTILPGDPTGPIDNLVYELRQIFLNKGSYKQAEQLYDLINKHISERFYIKVPKDVQNALTVVKTLLKRLPDYKPKPDFSVPPKAGHKRCYMCYSENPQEARKCEKCGGKSWIPASTYQMVQSRKSRRTDPHKTVEPPRYRRTPESNPQDD